MEFRVSDKPVEKLIIGDKELSPDVCPVFGDDRGFFTAINFGQGTKRGYVIRNHRAGVIRAFHGHRKESKEFYVIRGSFKVICISMDVGEWKEFTLNERCTNSLKIPAGTYNGFVSLTNDAELLVISNSTFEESKGDDYRLPYDLLGKSVWEVKHR